MGTSLIIQVEGQKKSFRLDPVATEAAMKQSEADAELESAMNVLFDVPDFGELCQRRCEDYRRAIAIAKEKLRESAITTYSLYSLEPGTSEWSSESGIGGIRINGEIYALNAGVERCILKQYVLRGGKLESGPLKDMRNEKSLMTDNCGEIKIRKRKRPAALTKMLNEVDKFLADISPDSQLSIMIA